MTIVKEREVREAADKFTAAGQAAERQMAFYLRRAFADRDDVLVFNDLRLVEGDDACQIDHLVLHSGGFILIESKSVTSKVKVNRRGEWSRLWDGHWKGMASPVVQGRMQADFLRKVLQQNREHLRNKMFRIKQKTFTVVDMAVLVAISDTGIIQREAADLAPEAVKADQVVEVVQALIVEQCAACSLRTLVFGREDEIRAPLDPDELERIRAFLLDRHRPLAAAPPPQPEPEPAPEPEPKAMAAGTACKHCSAKDLEIRHGKFGYYWKCCGCGGNTAIDKTAPDGSTGRIRKERESFFLVFGDGQEVLFHVNRTTSEAPENAAAEA